MSVAHNHIRPECDSTCPNRIENILRSAKMRCLQCSRVNCPNPAHFTRSAAEKRELS
jgi:hypothetical protein